MRRVWQWSGKQVIKTYAITEGVGIHVSDLISAGFGMPERKNPPKDI